MKLGVNVDHIATLRQARGELEPDPVAAACLCELAGCDSIVVHLREDRRHINERDLRLLRDTVKTRLNLEMSQAKEIVDIALEVRPDQVTLVPEKRKELTTEGGLDVVSNEDNLERLVGLFQKKGITVSLFIDPDHLQIKAAQSTGVKFIELHTGRYAQNTNGYPNILTPSLAPLYPCGHRRAQTGTSGHKRAEATQRVQAGTGGNRHPHGHKEEVCAQLESLVSATKFASKLGLRVNAGHGLNYNNVKPVSKIDDIEELNIGHSIVSRAVLVGLESAVKEMLALIKR